MNEYLIISTQVELLRMCSGDIMYVVADGNYSTFTFSNGETRMVVQQLGVIERLMSTQLRQTGVNFIRIGRSLIINKEYIHYINLQKQQLQLSNGHHPPCSLTASKEALRQLKELIDKTIQ